MSFNSYHTEIINYYNRSQKDYELIWGLKKHRSLHYGFWDKATKNHEQAINNLTEQVAKAAQLKPNMLLADLGCGIGGPACYLASTYNSSVNGISLAQKQITQANDFAKANNINATFIVGDYCNTPYATNFFDVVYAIESSCYANPKTSFLKEAYRILKPGGKLVVLDFFWTGNEKTEAEKTLMKNWCNSWAIENYAYTVGFFDECKEVGFTDVAKSDFTKNVLPSIKKLHFWFYPSLIGDWLLRLIGKRKEKHKNMYSALYQYQAYKKNLWQYMMFTAVK